MINGRMQLMVARQTDSQLSHTIRFPTSWQPWGDATAVVGALPGVVYDIAAAEVGGDVHYVAATNLGLFHSIRFSASPSWQPWGDIESVVGNPGDVRTFGVA
jgi:hypothetical protein